MKFTPKFDDLFPKRPAVVACIHLQPLPGAPLYGGSMPHVITTALREAEVFLREGVDGLIVENFGDKPFFPEMLPPETVAALTVVTREIVKLGTVPVGVNALRNDAAAAMSVATAAGAQFIRVNVHTGAVVADQGIIEGRAHETLRLRAALRSEVLIFADVGVKHAAPLGGRGLAAETRDVSERGMADALIVSGSGTGMETSLEDLALVRANSKLPLLIGSGVTPENLGNYVPHASALIVGSAFKVEGRAQNPVDGQRAAAFMRQIKDLRN